MSNLKYSTPTIEDIGNNDLGSNWFETESYVVNYNYVACFFATVGGLAVAAAAALVIGEPSARD